MVVLFKCSGGYYHYNLCYLASTRKDSNISHSNKNNKRIDISNVVTKMEGAGG